MVNDGDISIHNGNTRLNRSLVIAIFALFTIIYYLFTAYKVKEGDGVEYAFMVPESVETNPYQYVENLSDIWQSQCTHYQVVNGRFLLHFVVQIYCGLLPYQAFAISNAVMFLLMALLLAKLMRIDLRECRNALCVNCIAFLSICHTSFDAAHQIGYLWSTVAMLCFLVMYRNMQWYRWLAVVGAVVASLLIGSLHEAFAIPICALLIVDCCRNRGRLSAQQYAMAIAFGIGALITIAAPGNYVRLSTFKTTAIWMAPMQFAINLLMGWALLILLLIKRFDRRLPKPQRRIRAFIRREWVLFTAILVAMMAFAISGVVYRQAVQGINFLFVLLILKVLREYRLSKFWMVMYMLITVVTIYEVAVEYNICNRKYAEVQRQYYGSKDGIVVLPQPLYGEEFRRAEVLCIPYTWVARVKDRTAPDLHIYPEGLKEVPDDCDTTFLRDLGNETWLMVNSKSHPRTFTLAKYIFGIKITQHTVDFSSNALGLVKETDKWTAVAYYNEHKMFFKVRIELQD
jgi:hypothetical protein